MRPWLPGTLSRLLYSLGRLKHHDSRLLILVMSCLTVEHMQGCDAQQLAMIAWGLARLAHRPPRSWVSVGNHVISAQKSSTVCFLPQNSFPHFWFHK